MTPVVALVVTHDAQMASWARRRSSQVSALPRLHRDFEALVADLERQFRFIGDSGAYQFLYVVDEEVQPHGQWPASQQRNSGRRRA